MTDTPKHFSLQGRTIHKNPIVTEVDGRKRITCGFPVCTVSEWVDAETAMAILEANEVANSQPKEPDWKSLCAWYETMRPVNEWHEDDGPVLWWKLPVSEPPYCGTPLDDQWLEDYYTHFTPIVRNSVLGRYNEEYTV